MCCSTIREKLTARGSTFSLLLVKGPYSTVRILVVAGKKNAMLTKVNMPHPINLRALYGMH